MLVCLSCVFHLFVGDELKMLVLYLEIWTISCKKDCLFDTRLFPDIGNDKVEEVAWKKTRPQCLYVNTFYRFMMAALYILYDFHLLNKLNRVIRISP